MCLNWIQARIVLVLSLSTLKCICLVMYDSEDHQPPVTLLSPLTAAEL